MTSFQTLDPGGDNVTLLHNVGLVDITHAFHFLSGKKLRPTYGAYIIWKGNECRYVGQSYNGEVGVIGRVIHHWYAGGGSSNTHRSSRDLMYNFDRVQVHEAANPLDIKVLEIYYAHIYQPSIKHPEADIWPQSIVHQLGPNLQQHIRKYLLTVRKKTYAKYVINRRRI
jgi:hypothetical protein